MSKEMVGKVNDNAPKRNKRKKRGAAFFAFIGLLVLGVIAGGVFAYNTYFVPNKAASDGLQKADVALQSKPETPQVPAEVKYEKGYTYGKLRIPSIGLEIALTEGLSRGKSKTEGEFNLLNYTVAHVYDTKHPGQKSQIYLAGHNDMQFNSLGKLQDKAEVFVDMPYGTFKYIVHAAPAIDKPGESVGMVVNEKRGDAIQANLPYEELVLQTCYPLNQFSDTEYRFLVYAYPEGQTPVVSLPGYNDALKTKAGA